jgi:hypothetical protein
MPCFSCGTTYLGSRPGVFAALSRAAAKSAAARLRNLRVLPARSRVDWTARAAACERCPMRVISRGVSYCGSPFLENVRRDPVLDGCGCPTIAKSKDPGEHCPLNARHQPASPYGQGCDCKWCAV